MEVVSAVYVLRKGFGPFPAGTPASIIREHPNGSVGVIVNGNAFTVWKGDLAPVESAALRFRVDELEKLLAIAADTLHDAAWIMEGAKTEEPLPPPVTFVLPQTKRIEAEIRRVLS